MVLRRCRRLLGHEDEARDACQDVFLRIIARRHRLHDRFLSSLLYRVATNVCLNRIRDRRRGPEPVADDWLSRAEALHRQCSLQRISPGGCADLLACAFFVHQLQTSVQ